MKTLLWLDDTRDCFDLEANWLVFSPFELLERDEVIWVKSYKEFVEYIMDFGVPDGIAFDHDLHEKHYIIAQEGWSSYYGKERPLEEFTGYDAAVFLIKYCFDYGVQLSQWNCHSANPEGKENINSLLNNFKKFQDESSSKI